MPFTIGRTEYTMGFRNKTQGPDFFEDFTSQARQLEQAVEILTHIYAASPEERIALRDQLHEVEHRGDELNHEIIQRINSSFITPFDREDLQSLASHLDDCLDFIDEPAISSSSTALPTSPLPWSLCSTRRSRSSSTARR